MAVLYKNNRVLSENVCKFADISGADAGGPTVAGPEILTPTGDPPTVEATDLRRTYYLGEPVHALDGVSLTLPAGSFTAVMGPSGSGKSTLLNVLGCLDTPTSGTLAFNGRTVSGLDERSLADVRGQEVGFIFQTFNLLPRLTAVENVTLPTLFADVGDAPPAERARELLTDLGLADRLNHRPGELSGGQRQRVAIARALINDPALLLADEPTGNLDSENGERIMELFRDRMGDGRTLLVVTHEREVAEYADRIVHMVDGQIERIEQLNGNFDSRGEASEHHTGEKK